MASNHSYGIQVVSLCIGLVPAVVAIGVVAAARLEQRRGGFPVKPKGKGPKRAPASLLDAPLA